MVLWTVELEAQIYTLEQSSGFLSSGFCGQVALGFLAQRLNFSAFLFKDNDIGSLAGELNLRYVSVAGGVRKSELKGVLE